MRVILTAAFLLFCVGTAAHAQQKFEDLIKTAAKGAAENEKPDEIPEFLIQQYENAKRNLWSKGEKQARCTIMRRELENWTFHPLSGDRATTTTVATLYQAICKD